MQEKYKAKYRNAADAAAQTAAAPAAVAAAAARSPRCSQVFNGVREWQDTAKDGLNCILEYQTQVIKDCKHRHDIPVAYGRHVGWH